MHRQVIPSLLGFLPVTFSASGRHAPHESSHGRAGTVTQGLVFDDNRYPVDFRVCNALKIKPFQALLRNAPFCSLGEVGARGRAPAKP